MITINHSIHRGPWQFPSMRNGTRVAKMFRIFLNQHRSWEGHHSIKFCSSKKLAKGWVTLYRNKPLLKTALHLRDHKRFVWHSTSGTRPTALNWLVLDGRSFHSMLTFGFRSALFGICYIILHRMFRNFSREGIFLYVFSPFLMSEDLQILQDCLSFCSRLVAGRKDVFAYPK